MRSPSRSSWSTPSTPCRNRRNGRTWRSSSPMTTATAGTITCCRRSSTSPAIRPSTASASAAACPRAGSMIVAATASACRSSRSRPSRGATTSITRSSIPPRCCVSSRTTGSWVASTPSTIPTARRTAIRRPGRARSTGSPARSRGCSTSMESSGPAPAATISRSFSTTAPARSRVAVPGLHLTSARDRRPYRVSLAARIRCTCIPARNGTRGCVPMATMAGTSRAMRAARCAGARSKRSA